MPSGLPEIIYLLCALASAACTVLLLRAHLRSPTRMLFWSAIAFALMAADNALLVVDMVFVREYDLRAVRTFVGLSGMVVLLLALICQPEER